MPYEDTDRAVKYGLKLLDNLQSLDGSEANGSITKETAVQQRKEICGQMRSLLWNLKPWKKNFKRSHYTYYH